MLFNSLEFIIFFVIVFTLYYKTYNQLKLQNILVLVSSYIFYGWWDWRFLSLIIISSVCDFVIGRAIDKSQVKKSRKRLLMLSLFINLGFLGFFKYYNFFAESFSDFVSIFGFETSPFFLNIVLPVGISFYTFQTMSYTIDIYRGKMKSTDNLLQFMTFVSFFPQLVAGPIERASNLLPQFAKKRSFNKFEFREGIKQALWGLFKKIVIADNCAFYVNQIFENSDSYPGSVIVMGLILFGFQIYGDFSGYSDIAIGIARMMGINLMQNFRSPFLSESIQEFWRRWHISLSTWFRDYVYIPLGGSKVDTEFRKNLNVLLTFTISGFWHGSDWTYIIWGAAHGFFYFIQMGYSSTVGRLQIFPKNVVSLINMFFTYFAVTSVWILFRADSMSHTVALFHEVTSSSLFESPVEYLKQMGSAVKPFIIIISLVYLALFEIFNKDAVYSFQVAHYKKPIRWALYISLVLLLIFFRATGGKLDFIYFQF